jgi:hypothetical protein
MKKIILAISMLLLVSTASAQGLSGFLGGLFGKKGDKTENTEKTESSSSTSDLLSSVLGSILGGAMPLSEGTLEGTWNYTGTACVLESEAALANIGGTVVTDKIEEKLDGYLAKVGLKEGTCTFTFIGSDSCVVKIGPKELAGNYELNAEEKKINFNFYGYLNFTTHVAYNVTSMDIVFNADKLLALIQGVTSKMSSTSASASEAKEESSAGGLSSLLGSSSSTFSTISALLSNYDGMMLGVELKK